MGDKEWTRAHVFSGFIGEVGPSTLVTGLGIMKRNFLKIKPLTVAEAEKVGKSR